MTGVPAAMEAAGVEASIGTTAMAPEAAAALHEGKEGWTAGMMFGKEWGLWGLNIAVRSMLNEPLSSEIRPAEMLLTKNNVAEAYEGESLTGEPFVIKNALEQYEKIWGVS